MCLAVKWWSRCAWTHFAVYPRIMDCNRSTTSIFPLSNCFVDSDSSMKSQSSGIIKLMHVQTEHTLGNMNIIVYSACIPIYYCALEKNHQEILDKDSYRKLKFFVCLKSRFLWAKTIMLIFKQYVVGGLK